MIDLIDSMASSGVVVLALFLVAIFLAAVLILTARSERL
jgi:hypothetical protein